MLYKKYTLYLEVSGSTLLETKYVFNSQKFINIICIFTELPNIYASAVTYRCVGSTHSSYLSPCLCQLSSCPSNLSPCLSHRSPCPSNLSLTLQQPTCQTFKNVHVFRRPRHCPHPYNPLHLRTTSPALTCPLLSYSLPPSLTCPLLLPVTFGVRTVVPDAIEAVLQ